MFLDLLLNDAAPYNHKCFLTLELVQEHNLNNQTTKSSFP